MLENQSNLNFDDINFRNFSNSFVPYLYLDGHRSSNIDNADSEKYKSGFRFFLRFSQIMQKFGFKEMVTMVHTARNCYVKSRLESILSAIQESFNPSDKYFGKSSLKLYGDIELYKTMGYNDFYSFVRKINKNYSDDHDFNHHILINYSEEWALNNRDKINLIPEISSVIRFTKGFVSGGWIPLKMQETTFIYSQIPSVSEYWSDEALTALLFIALKNWSLMKQYIGKKEYGNNEKALIHNERDLNLNFCTSKLNISNSMHNRIIAFGIHGPILYEL